jgi:hypothetical protein
VQFGPAADALNLALNNTDLLSIAARAGENVTARITRESQTVIAQHGAYLSLDCSSILPTRSDPTEALPVVTWELSKGTQCVPEQGFIWEFHLERIAWL